MFEVPDGMSKKQFDDHPVKQMISFAAQTGQVPERHEIDRIDVAPSVRKRIADACRDVVAIHATGEQAHAWARGDEHAAAIVGGLPEEQRDPWWFRRPIEAELDERDPAALAEQVPRFHGLGGR
jgi:hypothetical protein